MVSFTESATLKVVDQSSGEIKKINAALKALFKTAKSLKSATSNIEVKTKGLQQAGVMIAKVAHDLKAIKGLAADIKVKVDATQARQQLAALKKEAQQAGAAARTQTARARTRARGAGIGGGGGGEDEDDVMRRRRRRGPTAGQYVHAAAQGVSTGFGLGIPLGGHPGLMALEAEAWAAAAALKKVAEVSGERDRARLMANVGTTPEQRRIFAQDAADKSKDRGPLPLSDTKRLIQQTSLLGDVAGATAGERAKAAINISDYIEKVMIPRQFALNPGKSFEEVQEGSRKLVQAMNLASSSIVNETDKFDLQGNLVGKKGQLSEEGKRVADAIQLAQAADPELMPQQIKSTLANLKTGALSMNSTALAKVLMSSGARGVRAANEIYRAQQAFTGTVDVTKFNNQLAKSDLLLNYQRNKKGNVIPGSGRAVDAELLQADPYEWLDKNLRPKMDKALDAQAETRFKKSGKASDREVTQEDKVEWLSRFMAGMSAAAKQGVIDAMIGNEQANQQLRQSSDAILKNNAPEAIKSAWTAQLQNIKTQLENQAAALGESAAAAMDLPKKMELLNRAISGDKDATKTLAKGALDSIVGVLKMSSLEVAAKALQGAGVDLTAAAYKLMGKEPPAKAGGPEEQTEADIKARERAEASITDAKAKQASIDERINRETDPAKRAQLEAKAAQFRSAAAEQEAAAVKERDAAEARILKRQSDIVRQAAKDSFDISDEDPAVISEVADQKAQEEAWKRIMQPRKAAAAKDAAMYAAERKRQSKLTEGQRERERLAHQRRKPTGAIGEEGPEPPAPKPEGPEKPPPPLVPDIMEEAARANQRASELNDGAATKMTNVAPTLQATAASFTTAFDSAPENIGRGGTIAIEHMQAGAGGIGAAIAAAFVAGASGVKVGVDVSGITSAAYKSPANKGALTTTAV